MKVKITKVRAYGDDFTNLTPGSIHETVEGDPKDRREVVWVMGAQGKPVPLFEDEYEELPADNGGQDMGNA